MKKYLGIAFGIALFVGITATASAQQECKNGICIDKGKGLIDIGGGGEGNTKPCLNDTGKSYLWSAGICYYGSDGEGHNLINYNVDETECIKRACGGYKSAASSLSSAAASPAGSAQGSSRAAVSAGSASAPARRALVPRPTGSRNSAALPTSLTAQQRMVARFAWAIRDGRASTRSSPASPTAGPSNAPSITSYSAAPSAFSGAPSSNAISGAMRAARPSETPGSGNSTGHSLSSVSLGSFNSPRDPDDGVCHLNGTGHFSFFARVENTAGESSIFMDQPGAMSVKLGGRGGGGNNTFDYDLAIDGRNRSPLNIPYLLTIPYVPWQQGFSPISNTITFREVGSGLPLGTQTVSVDYRLNRCTLTCEMVTMEARSRLISSDDLKERCERVTDSTNYDKPICVWSDGTGSPGGIGGPRSCDRIQQIPS